MRVLLAGCALALAVSAGSAGATTVSAVDVAQFKVGAATLADVEEKLGQPQSVTTIAGMTIIVYVSASTHVKGATFIPIIGLFAGGARAR